MRRSLIVEDILLIEPAYKNKYPPIGLMKIAYFHRYIMHDYVRFAKGRLPEGLENKKWDRVVLKLTKSKLHIGPIYIDLQKIMKIKIFPS